MAAALVLTPAVTQAAQFHVESDTVGDAYQLVTSDNELLNRRRIHQYLGFGAYDLLGDESHSLSIVTRFRFDADLGLSSQELEDIPTLRREHFSIQSAYVEGRDLFGMLDFKAGRQVRIGPLDWLMLDGVVARLRTPWFFGFEVEAGVEAADAFGPVTASQLELDGVRLLEEDHNPDGQPIQVTDRPKIVLGASLITAGLHDTSARFSYRRIFSDGKVRQERVGGAVYQRLPAGLHFDVSWSYDLYQEILDSARVSVRWQATDFLTAELQYVRLVPSFDAESIFNIFSTYPLNDLNARVRWHLAREQWAYVGGMVRLFENERYISGSLSAPVDEVVTAWGAMGGYRHSFGQDGRVGADLSWEGGYGGDRVLVDLNGAWGVLPGEVDLDGRLTVVYYRDELQAQLDGVSFGYQLGGRYDIAGIADLRLVLEHNFSRHQPSQLRVILFADVDLWL